jgi:TPR repeat protein
MYDVPIVEAQPEIEPVVPSSADDLYDQAKDIMQATSDPAAQAAAVELLTQAASMGHAESMRVLGLLALKQGPDRQAEAIELLERSAKTSVKAMRQLGILYGNLGSTHLDNTDKAIEYFQRASALGDGESSLYLSKVMARLGLQDDAKRWKEVAAEQGAVAAGAVTSTNPLPDRDDSMMRSYTLQRAAMAGDPASMYDYSLMLLNKQAQGALIGYEHAAEFEAYYWLRRSSQLGYTKATMKLDEVGYIESLMNASKLTFDKLNRAMSGART